MESAASIEDIQDFIIVTFAGMRTAMKIVFLFLILVLILEQPGARSASASVDDATGLSLVDIIHSIIRFDLVSGFCGRLSRRG